MTHNYNNIESYMRNTLKIRIKRQKEYHTVEYYDGIRIDGDTLPKGKHMYHTRHSDTDVSQAVTIAPEGTTIIVNYCGTIVTDYPLQVKEETKLMRVNWI